MMLKNRILRALAVRENVVLGRNFHVGPGSTIWAPARLDIGNDVYVGKHVTIEVDGSIGDQVLIANNVGIVGRRDHDIRQLGTPIRSATWVGQDLRQSLPVTIGSDVWIGFGAIVLSGVTIGSSSIVGAGSLVTRDVPENSIVTGVPASVVGNRFSVVDMEKHWISMKTQGVSRRFS